MVEFINSFITSAGHLRLKSLGGPRRRQMDHKSHKQRSSLSCARQIHKQMDSRRLMQEGDLRHKSPPGWRPWLSLPLPRFTLLSSPCAAEAWMRHKSATSAISRFRGEAKEGESRGRDMLGSTFARQRPLRLIIAAGPDETAARTCLSALGGYQYHWHFLTQIRIFCRHGTDAFPLLVCVSFDTLSTPAGWRKTHSGSALTAT